MVLVIFNKDVEAKKVEIKLTFSKPIDVIWDAFTNAATQEWWLPPRPYRLSTKEVDFREGGSWLSCMQSPEGEKFWSIVKYLKIDPPRFLHVKDGFCDENGILNDFLPQSEWLTELSETEGETNVHIRIVYPSREDMRKTMEMGFEEGYRMSLSQLQEMLDL